MIRSLPHGSQNPLDSLHNAHEILCSFVMLLRCRWMLHKRFSDSNSEFSEKCWQHLFIIVNWLGWIFPAKIPNTFRLSCTITHHKYSFKLISRNIKQLYWYTQGRKFIASMSLFLRKIQITYKNPVTLYKCLIFQKENLIFFEKHIYFSLFTCFSYFLLWWPPQGWAK